MDWNGPVESDNGSAEVGIDGVFVVPAEAPVVDGEAPTVLDSSVMSSNGEFVFIISKSLHCKLSLLWGFSTIHFWL